MTRTPVADHTDRVATRTTEVLIVGAGFGGLEVARAMGRAGIPTTVVDRRNHHLFQPLLYQVATAALSGADVAEPIRKIMRRHRAVEVILAEVDRIDTARRHVHLGCGQVVAYRHLVVAVGSRTSYFGHDDWAGHAPGLKSIEDARRIRSRLLTTFERAERSLDPAERQRLLTIAIVGGGPGGVELAGAIIDISRKTLARDFRNIDPKAARITLIEAGDCLLAGFPEDQSAYARDRLETLGVEVRTGAPVGDIGPGFITVDGRTTRVGLVVWAAGVRASPLVTQLAATDDQGRVPVDPHLRVRGLDDVYVLGDAARCPDAVGDPLPGLAQVAKQQGQHLGRALADHIRDGTPLPAFRYRSRGDTIARNAAVFSHHRFGLRGFIAWAAWAVIHVYLLVGFQNRALVSFQWLWRYLSHDRGARVIDGDIADEPPPERPA